MPASANDIALQLSEHIGGSVDAFVQMMNDRAAQLDVQILFLQIQQDFRTKPAYDSTRHGTYHEGSHR